MKAGDVLQVRVDGGFTYLHYIGRHSEYGDAVLVAPRIHAHQSSVTQEMFSGGYVAFYPVTAAVSQGLVDVAGHLTPASLPGRLRRPGAISGRRVETWIIEDGSQEVVKSTLSDEELRLPIAVIWNHELLVQRIVEGWDPVREGRAP